MTASDGLVLFLFVSGHEQREYVIEAQLQLKGTPHGLGLVTTSKLHETPASVEIAIGTEGLEPGTYDVVVTFDGQYVGQFPCEVEERKPARS